MDLVVISAVAYALATGATTWRLASGVSKGASLIAHTNFGYDDGPIQAVRVKPKLSVSNRTVAWAAGNLLLLLAINGAILAAALLFAIGAFTAGSGKSVLISSLIVGFITMVAIAVAVKKGIGAVSRVIHWVKQPGSDLFSGSLGGAQVKTTAKATVWNFALIGLVYATFVLFVAGVIRLAF